MAKKLMMMLVVILAVLGTQTALAAGSAAVCGGMLPISTLIYRSANHPGWDVTFGGDRNGTGYHPHTQLPYREQLIPPGPLEGEAGESPIGQTSASPVAAYATTHAVGHMPRAKPVDSSGVTVAILSAAFFLSAAGGAAVTRLRGRKR